MDAEDYCRIGRERYEQKSRRAQKRDWSRMHNAVTSISSSSKQFRKRLIALLICGWTPPMGWSQISEQLTTTDELALEIFIMIGELRGTFWIFCGYKNNKASNSKLRGNSPDTELVVGETSEQCLTISGPCDRHTLRLPGLI